MGGRGVREKSRVEEVENEMRERERGSRRKVKWEKGEPKRKGRKRK